MNKEEDMLFYILLTIYFWDWHLTKKNDKVFCLKFKFLNQNNYMKLQLSSKKNGEQSLENKIIICRSIYVFFNCVRSQREKQRNLKLKILSIKGDYARARSDQNYDQANDIKEEHVTYHKGIFMCIIKYLFQLKTFSHKSHDF